MVEGLRRLDVAGQHYEPLTPRDLAAVCDARKTSFSPEFWMDHIRDESHYEIVARAKSTFDCRLLYDSWLWRAPLEEAVRCYGQRVVLELLPGSSLTIPVALESIKYSGELWQVNDELPTAIPRCFHFRHRWLDTRIGDLLCKPLQANIIVGNHIVDDLLFDSYCGEPGSRKRHYYDALLCKAAWASLARSRRLRPIQDAVTSLFTQMIECMAYSSMLILRHYPSTFALMSDDLYRSNIEMETYYEIAKALSGCALCDAYFLDVSGVNAPAGSLYPASFLIADKRP